MSHAEILLSMPLPAPAVLAAAGAPVLARALARSHRQSTGEDLLLESRLFERFGFVAAGETELPVAAITAVEDGLDPARHWLRVDPVCLRPDLTDVILLPGDPPGFDREAAGALVRELNHALAAGGFEIVIGLSPLRWYLASEPPIHVQGAAPRRLAGRGIRSHLPAGADRRRLLGWLTEVQFLLHGASLNAGRVAGGLPPVNSVWPWGGGAWPPPARAAATPPAAVFADCALTRGLARVVGLDGEQVKPLAALACGVFPSGPLLVVQDAGPGVAIDPVTAEQAWAVPLLDALRRGRLRRIVIDTPTSRHVLGRLGLLRFWRRA